ncbi:response regulator [Pseudooceanicola sediminis]|uniref:histidine kinase n=1 Tax=Pseudooceanicola sediminis TaxID=2211117 RepID=A0A399J368_9RHOB|nr:ATP-binding protein [Pseudooceanicola sediminis]KAA2314276.1 response regulator [Puniceibacterium sp. HSS470]RII39868.1 response regulator [Pseudooceanicola sediminis]|tara:strand:- start:518 stop:2416 length:1899 start_codon:yes stop_codon:yes gene_type:complete
MNTDQKAATFSLRNLMSQLFQDRSMRLIILIVAVCCMIAIPGLNFFARSQQTQAQVAANELPLALHRLERELGYSGFIHNFKNAILRPDEPKYYERTLTDYNDAIATLDEIEGLGLSIGRSFDFSALKSTLDAYRGNLDAARRAAADGMSIAEVDDLVRVPDDAATLDLQALHDQVRIALRDWLRQDLARSRLQLLGLSVMFFTIAAVLILFVMVSYFAQRERERQSTELHNRLASLGQLTSGIAHDVNNLLATIYYAVDLTLGETIPETSRRFLHSAQRAIERGQDLTARLLSFARPQPGNAKTLMISEVFHNVRELALPNLGDTIQLRITEERPGLTVHCDQSQLENAILNMVLNSRDAMEMSGKGTRITLHAVLHGPDFVVDDARSTTTVHPARVYETAGPDRGPSMKDPTTCVLLSVIDDGPGMPDDVRQRALEPFFTTKAAHSGTGLGLSIVYGFAQSAGGDVQIVSAPGKGTSVQLLLPRGLEKSHHDALEVTRGLDAGRGQRVLLAEDEDGLRELLGVTLEQMGYSVIAAEHGQAALNMVKAGVEFDLLLSDIVMPGKIDGYELARQVRELRPSVPILYLTGNAGPMLDRNIAVKAPILRKPCPPDRLSDAIAAALAPTATAGTC